MTKKYHHCSRMRRLIKARQEGKSEEHAEPFFVDLPHPPRLPGSPLMANQYLNEMIKVEPMPMPSGLLFYLDYKDEDEPDGD